MDTLSHGLWGAVAFGRESPAKFAGAFALGVLPDLIPFGPGFVKWAIGGMPPYRRTPGKPPDPAMFPPYVHHLYDVTHSLLVWLAVFLIVWAILKRPPWILGAWALHILCDIPTHSIKFFPTPFLWPLKTPFVDGIRWSQPWFMILNYSLLAAAYWLAFAK